MVKPLHERDSNLDVPDDPDDVDAETFATWVSKHGDAVKDVLEEMTAVYADDGEKRPIKNASVSHVRPGHEYVGVQFDLPDEMDPEVAGANILRLLDDLAAHEIGHKNWSDLHAKRGFAESYPGWGRLPGYIQNTLEDEYVDSRRKVRWFGMRSKLAFYVWLHMNTEKRAPPVDETYRERGMEDALMSALLQTALAGYVNGIEDAPDEIAECMARVEPLLERIRALAIRDEKHDIDGRETADIREKIGHAVMNIIARYLPDPTEVDEDELEDQTRDTSETGDPEMAPDSLSGEAEMDIPDEMQEEMAEMFEELMDDEDVPDPVPEDAMDNPSPDPEMDGDGGDPGDGDDELPDDGGDVGTDEAGDDSDPGGEGEGESKGMQMVVTSPDDLGSALDEAPGPDGEPDPTESPGEDTADSGESPDSEGPEADSGGDPVDPGEDGADPGGSAGEGGGDGPEADASGDSGGETGGEAGDGADGGESEPSGLPDRDIEELVAEYGRDNLVVDG